MQIYISGDHKYYLCAEINSHIYICTYTIFLLLYNKYVDNNKIGKRRREAKEICTSRMHTSG